ncbi:MAG: glycosyltransferase family 4 protein [Nitrospinae bacterium]|nr:glycosyltransferase family 4 protein [Nitrospinota bacterium]
MNLLIITHVFPNIWEVNKGIYVREMEELAKHCNIAVIAPIPFYRKIINFLKSKPIKKIQNWNGFNAHYPTIIAIPKVGGPLYGLFYFFSILKLLFKLKKIFSSEVILSYWVYPDGFASVLASKILKLPVIIVGLGSDINEMPSSFINRKLITWTLKNADSVVSLSAAMKNEIINLGIPQDKIMVVPNGVDEALFYPADKLSSRKKTGLPMEKRIILYVGRLSSEKGVNHLIDAVPRIRDKEPDILLVIIGTGGLLNKLMSQTKDLGIEGNVLFLGERLHSDIPVYINASELLLLPSLCEGCPNVVLEALACGTPVIASNVGGVPEIITSEDLGMLVYPADPDALADAVIKAFSKKWDPIKMSKYIKHKFGSWGTKAKAIMDIANKTKNGLAGQR